MSRYITIAGKPGYIETPLWDDAKPQKLHLTVDGAKTTYTGLLDAKGNRLYRVQDPIGFRR